MKPSTETQKELDHLDFIFSDAELKIHCNEVRSYSVNKSQPVDPEPDPVPEGSNKQLSFF